MKGQYLLDDVGGRKARLERHELDLAAGGFNGVAPGDPVSPVGPLDEDVGHDASDDFFRRILVENSHGIDGGKGGQRFGPLPLVEDGPVRTFQPMNAFVTIDGND